MSKVKVLEDIVDDMYDEQLVVPRSAILETMADNARKLAEQSANKPGRDDWMTPDWLLDKVRLVLGEITTDPCSSAEAQTRVQAKTYYTKFMNGLEFPWYGSVWLNPPYSRGVMGLFVDKLIDQVHARNTQEAIVIANNATDTVWAHRLFEHSNAVLFFRGRVHYVLPGGKVMNQTRQGQMLFYLGDKPWRFEGVFGDLGAIMRLR